jgi:hypothetical protein
MKKKNYRIPIITDDKIENSELLQNIKKRRGGKLLNLDRALLISQNFVYNIDKIIIIGMQIMI